MMRCSALAARAPRRPAGDPVIGRVAGQGATYRYLVGSVQAYPSPERIAEIMGEAGLVDVTWQGMSGGIVTLHEGTVPPRWGCSASGITWHLLTGTGVTHRIVACTSRPT